MLKSKFRYILAAAAAFIPLQRLCAQEPVILFDARRQMTCVAPRTAEDCLGSLGPDLNIGKIIRFRVTNPKFLTLYRLHIGGEEKAAQVSSVAGMAVAPLDLGLYAVTQPDAKAPVLERISAQAVFSSLLDVVESANTLNRLSSQQNELSVQHSAIWADIQSFDDAYARIAGNEGADPDCGSERMRSGQSLYACLVQEWNSLKSVWTRPGWRGNDDFLRDTQKWQRYFQDVQLFSQEFRANKLADRAQAIEAQIIAYNRNVEAFEWNLRSCWDATEAARDLNTSGSALVGPLRVQLRAQMAKLAPTGSPSLSEEELNAYVSRLERLLQDPNSLQRRNQEALRTFVQAALYSRPRFPDFDDDLNGLRDKIQWKLPRLVKWINDLQSQAAAFLNSLYDTRSPDPIEEFHSLEFDNGETAISYSVGVIHRFQPFVLEVVSQSPSSMPKAEEEIVASGAFLVSGPTPAAKRTVISWLRHIF